MNIKRFLFEIPLFGVGIGTAGRGNGIDVDVLLLMLTLFSDASIFAGVLFRMIPFFACGVVFIARTGDVNSRFCILF